MNAIFFFLNSNCLFQVSALKINSRPSLKNSFFAVADPHFLEWVGR
jgi:hypothetical protein